MSNYFTWLYDWTGTRTEIDTIWNLIITKINYLNYLESLTNPRDLIELIETYT